MIPSVYIGYVAATLGTICWVPQAWKAWSTRDTSGISLASNLLFFTTVSLWLLYGIMIGDWPIIVANVCAATAVAVIVAAKLKYK
ncbi:SemiSWEET transporter [Lentibacter algarum]|uniref:SemiSWEET family sugar transporter n=1 Tax=Lentibacter algarum TaxID=576131 RepID=UPI001C06E31E|nr:SemiSWEET transporter [Lentibacter algarum]MBU2981626.1 SemiSWEET transporter [Lentibacter algarum]